MYHSWSFTIVLPLKALVSHFHVFLEYFLLFNTAIIDESGSMFYIIIAALMTNIWFSDTLLSQRTLPWHLAPLYLYFLLLLSLADLKILKLQMCQPSSNSN